VAVIGHLRYHRTERTLCPLLILAPALTVGAAATPAASPRKYTVLLDAARADAFDQALRPEAPYRPAHRDRSRTAERGQVPRAVHVVASWIQLAVLIRRDVEQAAAEPAQTPSRADRRRAASTAAVRRARHS